MKIKCFAASLPVFFWLLTPSSLFAQAAPKRMFGKASPFTIAELPEGKLKSQLRSLDPQARAKAMEWLHRFNFESLDAAHHLRADRHGGIFYVCADCHGNCDGHGHAIARDEAEQEAAAAPEDRTVLEGGQETQAAHPSVANASVPVSTPPAYHSKPGATFHIYIDLNGAYVTGKSWSETDGTTTWTTWDCEAWSSDGDKTTFSDSEQADIRRSWERVSVDYAPFDVNVTTDAAYDPDTYSGDKNKVGWLLVTPTTDKTGARCPHFGSGGVGYMGVYGESTYFSNYQPAWVTPSSAENIAEAASHEMGHNMGLSHDGSSSLEYYGGHDGTASAPSWGPIMGTGYGRNVSQWSKGEYHDANNTQDDDLDIISNRVPYRADDFGGSFGAASVWLDPEIDQSGIIERTGDNDVFTFSTGSGTISFQANPYKCDSGTWGGNLDIVMELYDSSQSLVASSNQPDNVTASISYNAAAGDYYLVIKPTGCGTPTVASPSGYTVYGSVGQYKVTGSIIPVSSILLTSPNGGESWPAGSTRDITWASGMGGNVTIELLKGGNLHSTIVASTPNDSSYSWTIPWDLVAASDYTIRIRSVETPAKSDTSLAAFSITENPLALALDTTDFDWTTDGGGLWYLQSTVTQDGVDAAQSGGKFLQKAAEIFSGFMSTGLRARKRRESPAV